MAPRVVVISGYFNPIHSGHVAYVRLAKEFAGPGGFVYAIVNTDAQSLLKKGVPSLVPERDRLAVVSALRHVDRALLSMDTDRTVRVTLEHLCVYGSPRPTHFANGGDVVAELPCAETEACRALGIELVYGLGEKIQSSSWIIEGKKNR